jgi:hypothetical protein
MLANTDVRDAELGGYGPDGDTFLNKSSDYTSQNYLYSALFDRPMDLTANDQEELAKGIMRNPKLNREAYRTYWRLMPASNQANLRAFTLNMAKQKLINDISFDFKDSNSSPQKTTFVQLYDALSAQVILFWHFPFVRIGCLISYPVCPEYAQAQRELMPKTNDLRELLKKLPIDPALAAAIDELIGAFDTAISLFGFPDISGPYQAFVPFDFDSVRGYIIKRSDEEEDAAAKKYPSLLNDTVLGVNPVKLNNYSRETLPYIGAIYQGLLSPKFGMIPALEPQWIVDKYATPDADIISDYKTGNSTSNFPEVKISNLGFLATIQEEITAVTTDPWTWFTNKIKTGIGTISNLFSDNANIQKINYTGNKVTTEPMDDNEKPELMEQYENMKNCPLPVSYHLISPKTAPKSEDQHHQIVTIKGDQLEWSFDPQCKPKDEVCRYDKNGDEIPGSCKKRPCKISIEDYEDGDQCCVRAWSVSGTKHGKALTVLNNPKQTDIKKAVASEPQISFYDMMLPDGATKIPNAEIDAPIAKNKNTSGNDLATAPNGNSIVTNKAESIMRENNLAQDSMHYLQSCWTVPKELQNSPRCKNTFGPETSTGNVCTGELFAQLFQTPDAPSSNATSYFNSFIKPKLTPEVVSAYMAAEQATGIPCEVFAGIHFEEGDNNPNSSLQDGRPLNGKTLTESAIQAGEELKGKTSGSIGDLDTLITALSRYNGGGNSNCQDSFDCTATTNDRCGAALACYTSESSCSCPSTIPEPGSCRDKCGGIFPWVFDYSYCSNPLEGYDDPYVTNWWKSPEHDSMYLLYMLDCTQTKPQIHLRPGSLTVAINLFLSDKAP